MRIDPKQFTFDMNERDVLSAALRCYVRDKSKRIEKLRNGKRQTENMRIDLDYMERATARAQDLYKRLTGEDI